MYVIKRNGTHECFNFEKLLSRIQKMCYLLDMMYIKPSYIADNVFSSIYNGVFTSSLDKIAAEIAGDLTSKHSDYAILAGRLAISNLHKETNKKFTDVVKELFVNDTKNGKNSIIDNLIYDVIIDNSEKLNSAIVYNRDYNYTYFGFKTLERSFLMKINGKILERPQHMLMRVSVGIHRNDIYSAIETYNLMSKGLFIHSTPTLLNSGTINPQLSSCFLLTMTNDNVEEIYDTLNKCAIISKYSGGIGLNITNTRSFGSENSERNGTSNGIVPMLRIFNDTARYFNQAGNKRPGAIAIFIEPWHADIFEFLQLKQNIGQDEKRARDLFYGLWIPDLFMRRVEANETWSLMCPLECPDLLENWGENFERLYLQYEKGSLFKKQVDASILWTAIVKSQTENGTPFMLYKDHCNRKSNQINLGTIKCSNLCTEIIQYSSKEEISVCTLASIALNKFVDKTTNTFNFAELKNITKIITKNLNKIIDNNFYPLPETKLSNLKHRPIGIGVQGLADTFCMLRIPFESSKSKEINKMIFETIYFGALEASCELSEKLGSYKSFKGSPASNGILQFDLWGKVPSDLWNWKELKDKIQKFGLRNSQLVALMPTATTAQILGNNESFEPFTSNIYTRQTLAGQFQIVNPYLIKDLSDNGIWNEKIKMDIISERGSVQKIKEIPLELKEIYKTVWEISQKVLIDMAVDRAPFIDQSQSLNIFINEPTVGKLTSMHFYGWKLGLKTGMYYLRTKSASQATQFTVDNSKISTIALKYLDKFSGNVESDDKREKIICEVCES